jgi:formylglycine-generating enzyme required for sulfatase activity
MARAFFLVAFLACSNFSEAQRLLPNKLQDTGQTTSYTSTSGEDADFVINPQSFTDNGDGTVTDNNTGLMWQKTDGGEMTFESASTYCTSLNLGGYTDWRLPANHELFGLNKYDVSNPAVNTTYFTKTAAEYWWTSEVRVDDATRVWVVNAGGGTGAHPKSETVSAGGTKKIHVRAVRDPYSTFFNINHFTDLGDGTIKDNFTGLTWQKLTPVITMTWEEALTYASGLILSEKKDWRLPNIKELQSLNDEKLSKPSIPKTCFPNFSQGNYWTSTTQLGSSTRAWDMNVDYGIVSYNEKTLKQYVILVRGGNNNTDLNLNESDIPGGEFMMGDHFNFVDPSHPSDEFPLHKVKVSSFYCAKTETTNNQFLAFLNEWFSKNLVEVKNNTVYLSGTSDIICYINQFASYYNISFEGQQFLMANFRGNHPMVGVMWSGAVAFCNWLSVKNGLDECYNLKTWDCDFNKNGYRLPTEAEWEFAGRGGKFDTYYNYPNGNILDPKQANLPNSGDPYESAGTNNYPLTTPVAFYDGSTHLKTEFNWPGSSQSYQTNNGENGYGLFDMQGNVWEFINDWYGQNYYSISPYENPTGPTSGFIMPDGKSYRGMRGGNWYNGLNVDGISDGHSRVSNRNPSYYRGPQDPNHPYYHLGFRVVRKYVENTTGFSAVQNQEDNSNLTFSPNPMKEKTTIRFFLEKPQNVTVQVYNLHGQLIATLLNQKLDSGLNTFEWAIPPIPSGLYTVAFKSEYQVVSHKIIVNR